MNNLQIKKQALEALKIVPSLCQHDAVMIGTCAGKWCGCMRLTCVIALPELMVLSAKAGAAWHAAATTESRAAVMTLLEAEQLVHATALCLDLKAVVLFIMALFTNLSISRSMQRIKKTFPSALSINKG
jgi:hypothetical protein